MAIQTQLDQQQILQSVYNPSNNKLQVEATLDVESIEIGTVDQGTPNSDANGWPVKITDGTHGEVVVTAANALKVDGSAVTQPISGTVTVSSPSVSVVDKFRNDYSINNATTAAYLQVLASTSATTKKLEIFDSSGQTLLLATGAMGSEVDLLYITPGGNGQILVNIASGTRLSVKAVSANATVGELTVNTYNN